MGFSGVRGKVVEELVLGKGWWFVVRGICFLFCY